MAATAAVTATERMRIGFGVLLLSMRNVVITAKQLATIDALAPGRLLVGVGARGENPAEWEAALVPRSERGFALTRR